MQYPEEERQHRNRYTMGEKCKKRFLAFVRMCCEKLKKVNRANESEIDNLWFDSSISATN